MAVEKRWLTTGEISALLSINRKVVSTWCLSRRLPAARIGGRGPWRVDRFQLEKDLESQIKENQNRKFK
jgi:hypothetical protein